MRFPIVAISTCRNGHYLQNCFALKSDDQHAAGQITLSDSISRAEIPTMSTLINIGVAQSGVAMQPAVLRTILGSCVGVCIYDRMKKHGGLAHVLLPSNPGGEGNPDKYADNAIPRLLERLYREGCRKEFMSAKIAGGASMFKFSAGISLGQIGERNVEGCLKILAAQGIPVVAEDTGGSAGRVIDFFLEDGRLKVKAAGTEKLYYKV